MPIDSPLHVTFVLGVSCWEVLDSHHQDTRFGTSRFFALLAASYDPKDEEKYCFADELMP